MRVRVIPRPLFALVQQKAQRARVPFPRPLFVLTNSRIGGYLRRMTTDQAIQVIQVGYPQVYLACHTRHQRKRSTEHQLSARDASILAHLDERDAIAPSRLAAHLGVARSTLSEALKRLVALGFVRDANASARNTAMLLTAKGARAIRDTSVLETRRLRAALDGLSERDLRTIARGMARLAAACREMAEPTRARSGRAREASA